MPVNTTIKPLNGIVALKPNQPLEKTKTGLFIPLERQHATEATVIAIASQVEQVKVNDIVSFLCAVDAGNTLDINGQTIYLVKESELSAVIMREYIEPTEEETVKQIAIQEEVQALPEWTPRTKLTLHTDDAEY